MDEETKTKLLAYLILAIIATTFILCGVFHLNGLFITLEIILAIVTVFIFAKWKIELYKKGEITLFRSVCSIIGWSVLALFGEFLMAEFIGEFFDAGIINYYAI